MLEKLETIMSLYQQLTAAPLGSQLRTDLKQIFVDYLNQVIDEQKNAEKAFLFITSDGLSLDDDDRPTMHEQCLGIGYGATPSEALLSLLDTDRILSEENYKDVEAYRLYATVNKNGLVNPDALLTLEDEDEDDYDVDDYDDLSMPYRGLNASIEDQNCCGLCNNACYAGQFITCSKDNEYKSFFDHACEEYSDLNDKES